MESSPPGQEPEEDLIAAIQQLYQQPDGSVGGPLHVLIDDGNYGYIQPFRGPGDDWLPETWRLAQQISQRMAPMTLDQRAAVVKEFWRRYREGRRTRG